MTNRDRIKEEIQRRGYSVEKAEVILLAYCDKLEVEIARHLSCPKSDPWCVRVAADEILATARRSGKQL